MLRKTFAVTAAALFVLPVILGGCSDDKGNPANNNNTGTTVETYTLTVNRVPVNGGTAVQSPSKTAYAAGDTVTVTATAAEGYEFTGWTGATTSKDAVAKIVIDSNRTVTANFKKSDPVTPPKDSTVTPKDSTVTPKDSTITPKDSTVTPKDSTITPKDSTVTPPKDSTITYELAIIVMPDNSGSVVRSPSKTAYAAGDTVTVTATAAEGYEFAYWRGPLTYANGATAKVVMNMDMTIIADFRTVQQDTAKYRLKINMSPENGGTITKSPNMESYPAGTNVVLTAIAASGYKFDFWYIQGQSDGSSTDTTLTITITKTTEILAYFYIPQTPKDTGTFKTVKIGTQTWTAENLSVPTKSGSWCYFNSENLCDQYGRLYDWTTAKTVCPSGWHLPSREEWGTLAKFLGGTGDYGKGGTTSWKLRATSGWGTSTLNGTDDYGFAALPGGGWFSQGKKFSDIGNAGYWWTSTESSEEDAYVREIYNADDYIDEERPFKTNGYSVRCVKD